MKINLEETEIQLLDDNGDVFLEKGILIEGDGLCAIYSNGSFDFVCTAGYELDHILTSQNLTLQELTEERLCSHCKSPMQEGFYFESDGTQYCSKECLTKVISWGEYLDIYDNGDGNAYWTAWED
ncbi:hypothetical protein [Sporosarcina ureilytica]|uniref:Uncharacterized protein n=1 Tax=Sporosarcina ureilytica TaxID=298596 RepID=A0A1D8JCL8_9BACL|nr:hypothetical protein [Sporosarcina ureilytica]AOV06458.1 hypothetical protein BI350_01775 [Sporosarcina ureilytica]